MRLAWHAATYRSGRGCALPASAPATGFQLRWAPDHLTASVEVLDADDDGAGEVVDLFLGSDQVSVARDGTTSGEAVVRSTDGGYAVVVRLPADGLAQGGTLGFDVRVTDGEPASQSSWNDLPHDQEDGARLGVVTLMEPVGFVEVPEAIEAPTIDGEIDAVWADAPVVTTDTLVEGGAGATADVSLLWGEDTRYALFVVTDDGLDAMRMNAWEQDSVEIFLDPSNAKAGAYRPQDGQYRIGFENAVSISGDLDVIGDNLTSATSVTDDGYVVEVAITLVEGAVSPEPDPAISLGADRSGWGARSRSS